MVDSADAERAAFEQAVAAYFAATRPILDDPAVWREEDARADAPAYPWPPLWPKTQADRFFQVLAVADVEWAAAVLAGFGHPRAPEFPLQGSDPRLQLILRVVQRSRPAGVAAVVALVGGDRINGLRALKNRSNEQWTDFARRFAIGHGLTLNQAFAVFGLPRRQAFRARKRAVTRRK